MANHNSDMITDAISQAVPDVLPKRSEGLKIVIDQLEVTTAMVDNADDNIFLCLIPSDAIVLDVKFLNDDLDAHATPTLAANIGLVYTGIGSGQNEKVLGDAVDVDCFATAITTFQAATTTYQSVRFEEDDIADIGKPAWEVGGLTSNPGGYFALVIDLTTAAATAQAGTLVARVDYI